MYPTYLGECMINLSLDLSSEFQKRYFNAGLSDLESQLDPTTFKHQTEKVEEDFSLYDFI